MKKITPILILIIITAVVSVSGCIHYVDSDDNSTISDVILQDDNTSNNNVENTVVSKTNKTGNIQSGTQSTSDKIKKNREKNGNTEPKLSKSDIEKEIVRIMKFDNPKLNYTAEASLTYVDNKPVYIVDVYDDFGWCAYLEVDGDNGPEGNDEEGYAFLGGAVRGETGDEANPIDGVMPKLSKNEAMEIMDKELKNSYSIEEPSYDITGYLNDSTPHYNITIEKYSEKLRENENIGTAYMNANTGEIIYINMTTDTDDNDTADNDTKIYSVEEAGDYVDIVYKGKTVSVRENYPYYSPQDDKIFYSQEEEAEWLYNDPRGD